MSSPDSPWWAARDPEAPEAPSAGTPVPPAPEPVEVLPPPVTAAPAESPALERPTEEGLTEESAEQEAERPSRGPLLPVLSALTAVLVGLTAFLGWQWLDGRGDAPVERSRTEALASAREAARLVFSYDYKQLDKDFAAGKSVITGEFAKEYERTTGKLVEDVAPRYKAVVSADVSDAGVVRATEDEVVCLVFVNQTSTSSLATTPKITQSRLEMTMTRSGGAWKVAKINAL